METCQGLWSRMVCECVRFRDGRGELRTLWISSLSSVFDLLVVVGDESFWGLNLMSLKSNSTSSETKRFHLIENLIGTTSPDCNGTQIQVFWRVRCNFE